MRPGLFLVSAEITGKVCGSQVELDKRAELTVG